MRLSLFRVIFLEVQENGNSDKTNHAMISRKKCFINMRVMYLTFQDYLSLDFPAFFSSHLFYTGTCIKYLSQEFVVSVTLCLILLEQSTCSGSSRSQLTSPVLHILFSFYMKNKPEENFLFGALLGMAGREVQKKPWGMSPEPSFHPVLLLLTLN